MKIEGRIVHGYLKALTGLDQLPGPDGLVAFPLRVPGVPEDLIRFEDLSLIELENRGYDRFTFLKCLTCCCFHDSLLDPPLGRVSDAPVRGGHAADYDGRNYHKTQR